MRCFGNNMYGVLGQRKQQQPSSVITGRKGLSSTPPILLGSNVTRVIDLCAMEVACALVEELPSQYYLKCWGFPENSPSLPPISFVRSSNIPVDRMGDYIPSFKLNGVPISIACSPNNGTYVLYQDGSLSGNFILNFKFYLLLENLKIS